MAHPITTAAIVMAFIASTPIFADQSSTGSIKLPENTSTCPAIEALQKNPVRGTWFASTKAGFWKSYEMSFATRILKFVGAQWQGENVGQLTCIYTSEQISDLLGVKSTQATLPIQLVYHSSAYVPSGGKWTHPRRGVRDCISHNQNKCFFRPILQQNTGNIFQEAQSFKDNQPAYVAPPPN